MNLTMTFGMTDFFFGCAFFFSGGSTPLDSFFPLRGYLVKKILVRAGWAMGGAGLVRTGVSFFFFRLFYAFGIRCAPGFFFLTFFFT